MIFGSGLRNGFANLSTVPAYSQFNIGLSHAFKWSPDRKPLTVRFTVVNLFDTVYEIRDGTGIGLRADKSVAYVDLMDLMNDLRAAGYLKIGLVGIQSDR